MDGVKLRPRRQVLVITPPESSRKDVLTTQINGALQPGQSGAERFQAQVR